MIIRFSARINGIGDYLVNGRVRTTGVHRDEYDTRVPIHGSLEAIERDANWIAKYRSKWDGAYKHITISYDESDVKKYSEMPTSEQDEMHKAIVDEVLRANVPHRDLDELNYYAEMHIPTRKHMLDDNGQRRKPHLHVAVSLLDHKTQKKLEFYNPNDLSYHSAVQSEINARYGFLDPVTVMERNAEQQIDRVTPVKGKSTSHKVRQALIKYLQTCKPKSGAELTKALMDFEHIAPVSSPITPVATKGTKGNRYLKIKINRKKDRGRRGEWRSLNVRGEGLEFLEYLYDKYRVDSSNEAVVDESVRKFKREFMSDTSSPFSNNLLTSVFSDKIEPKLSAKSRRKRVDSELNSGSNFRVDLRDNHEYRRNLIDEKRKKFLSKSPNRSTKERKEQARRNKQLAIDESRRFIRELTRQQRQFYCIYKTNIDKDFVEDGKFFKPRENPDQNHFYSKRWGCYIIDHGDMITADTSSKSPLDKIAALMVQQGLAKGWALESIQATEGSSDEFRAAVARAIEKQRNGLPSDEIQELNVKTTKLTTHTKYREPPKNLYTDRFERELSERVNRRAGAICSHVKSAVTSEMITAILERFKSLGRAPDFDSLKFERNDKKHLIIIVDVRRRYNAIDFLNKVVGISVSDAVDEISRQIELAKPKKVEVLDDDTDRGFGGGAGQNTNPEPEPRPAPAKPELQLKNPLKVG